MARSNYTRSAGMAAEDVARLAVPPRRGVAHLYEHEKSGLIKTLPA